jgi:hypothetical protein
LEHVDTPKPVKSAKLAILASEKVSYFAVIPRCRHLKEVCFFANGVGLAHHFEHGFHDQPKTRNNAPYLVHIRGAFLYNTENTPLGHILHVFYLGSEKFAQSGFDPHKHWVFRMFHHILIAVDETRTDSENTQVFGHNRNFFYPYLLSLTAICWDCHPVWH